ncbi:MAG: hypothetical protein LBM23_03410 [Propionibacteriaceae bacterium]|jgi:hypothetical protein|nr:hypothetical protein [Propionibacteriaceae bacterium]
MSIYVVCPPRIKTGGTELLHQLVFALLDIGRDAKIAYVNPGINPTPAEFRKYCESWIAVSEIPDDKDNIIVLPETLVSVAHTFPKEKKYIWWLSVDNYLRLNCIFAGTDGAARRFLSYFKHKKWRFSLRELTKREDCLHLVQSEYARQYLLNHGISPKVLSDYISSDYLPANISFSNRKNIVVYNPKKGLKFAKQIISHFPQFSYVPLVDMSTEEIIQLLDTAKVYIDFGPHPGKDRFPREAAMRGCCVITGRKGSAANAIDVPIPWQYKFYDSRNEIPRIGELIYSIFFDFDAHAREFDHYRDIISTEKDEFYKSVNDIFTDSI